MRQVPGAFALAILVALAAWGAGGSAAAQPQSGKIVAEGAWARRAPMMGHATPGHGGAMAKGNGAVYVTLKNPGAEADALVSAATDAADKVELHETVHDAGVMRMRPLPSFPIPAGGALEMKPGGRHLMLFGLTRELKPGETVRVTLTFERAGTLSVEAPVR